MQLLLSHMFLSFMVPTSPLSSTTAVQSEHMKHWDPFKRFLRRLSMSCFSLRVTIVHTTQFFFFKTSNNVYAVNYSSLSVSSSRLLLAVWCRWGVSFMPISVFTDLSLRGQNSQWVNSVFQILPQRATDSMSCCLVFSAPYFSDVVQSICLKNFKSFFSSLFRQAGLLDFSIMTVSGWLNDNCGLSLRLILYCMTLD